MRITPKGQVTIPVKIREELGFLPDTELEFKVSGNKLIVAKTKVEHGRGRKLVERMRGTAGKGMSTDEIMALTRGE
jgi:AbrB family looped-hinge helix DNA binding protein